MEPLTLNLIGNLRSKEAHDRDCWWAKRISRKKHLVSLKEALFQGFDGCGHCLKKHDHMVKNGLLILDEPFPNAKGEFILPRKRLSFNSYVDGDDVIDLKYEIHLDDKTFEVALKEHNDDFKYTVTTDYEKLAREDKSLLFKFWKSLKERIASEPDQLGYMRLLGKAINLMLANPKITDRKFKKQEARTKGVKADLNKQHRVQKALSKDLTQEEKASFHGRTVNDFIVDEDGKLLMDETGFVQNRRGGSCIYKGEAIQGWWADGEGQWHKAWGIVDGVEGGTGFGCGGTNDLIGDVDIYIGWYYGSYDHDMCVRHEGKCAGPCLDESVLAAPEFVALALANAVGFPTCTGNQPPENMVIKEEELQQRYYTYNTDHPMDGRKIGTPASWRVDINKSQWHGEPIPDIDKVSAEPSPFRMDTGTRIEVQLNKTQFDSLENQDLPMKVKLYHEDNLNTVVPVKILKMWQNGHIYYASWDGRNDSGLFAPSGLYSAEIIIDGSLKKTVDNLLTFDGSLISTDTRIYDIRVSPNPFSIKQPPKISFKLKDEASVSGFIYHENWAHLPTATLDLVREGKPNIPLLNRVLKKDKLYECLWDCRNYAGLESFNGPYKLVFRVNGKTRIVEDLKKDKPGEEGNSYEAESLLETLTVSPNPFSIETKPKIHFRLKKPAEVNIAVYHSRGHNPVKVITRHEMFEAGPHTKTWNCKNEYDLPALNGYYKVKVEVEGKSQVVDHLLKVWQWQL